jgi:hypothetical protein
MFADPQSVTVSDLNGGSAISLPRIIDEALRSVYRSNDGLVTLTISHAPKGTPGTANYRVSSMIRLDTKVLAADPLNADRSIYQSASVWTVIDRPEFGFTVAQLVARATALVTLLSASTYAAVTKLAGQEH